MSPDPADAAWALACMAAEDTYTASGLSVLEPALDARLAPDWAVRGFLSGSDTIFRSGPVQLTGGRVFYGWLLASKRHADTFALVIRGTHGILEWIEDAEFALAPHPIFGAVEAGFFGLYQSLRFRSPGGADRPLVEGVAAEIGAHPITVVGHSLGAALAAYAAFDLAVAGPQVAARLFAPPRPGDAVFAGELRARVPDCAAYGYAPDLVPHVPLGFGYVEPPTFCELYPEAALAAIRMSVLCNHHAYSYAAMLDPSLVSRPPWSPAPAEYAACILELHPPAGATP